MALYKRGGIWWFDLVFKGRHIQKSTSVRNKRVAEEIRAAYRTQLAKGEVGIEKPEEPGPIPAFNQAMKDFLEWSEQEYAAHPNTHRRYRISSAALLRYFGTTPLDRITSDDVEKFKTTRAKQKGSDNRNALLIDATISFQHRASVLIRQIQFVINQSLDPTPGALEINVFSLPAVW